MVQIPI